VNTYAKLAAAAAAVLILAVVAWQRLPVNSTPGAVATPSASAGPSPTARAAASASSRQLSSITFKPKLTIQAPVGWTIEGDGPRAIGLKAPVPTSGIGAGSILLMNGPFVTTKDPQCHDEPPAGSGASAAEILAALVGDPRLLTSAPVLTRVGDRSGQAIDLRLADSWDKTCDWSDGKPALPVLFATADGPGYGMGGAEVARIVLLDVVTNVVAIIVTPAAGDTGTDSIDQAMPIVAAMQFTP